MVQCTSMVGNNGRIMTNMLTSIPKLKNGISFPDMAENRETRFGSLSIEGVSVGDTIAIFLLPIMLFTGWLVAVFGEFQLSIWPIILLISISIFASIIFVLRTLEWAVQDLRWLWVPMVILFTSWLDLTWTGPMLWDQADHLQTANRYLGHWEWEPFHQERDFSFRPKLISGLVAFEFSLTSGRTYAFFVPYLLLLGSGWQIQRFVEEQEGKAWSLLAVTLVLTMPTMMMYGRTIYLEAMVTGGLVLIIRDILLTNISNLNEKDAIRWGIITSLIGAIKYPYLYLGAGGLILLYGLSKNLRLVGIYVAGWVLIQAPFAISDFFAHNNAFASFGPQFSGAITSITSEVGNYTSLLAFKDIQSQLLTPLLILFTLGLIIWLRKNTSLRLGVVLFLILPAIIIFTFILDFGWPRYHLPWLAVLMIVGISGIVQPLPTTSSKQMKQIYSIGLVILFALSSIQIYGTLTETLDERETMENRIDFRWEFIEHYSTLKSDIPENAIVLAGYDISLGLRYEVPTYRYGPSEDPIHDSIVVVNATHVVTGGMATRFSWERNPMETLGAPLIPISHSSIENDHHILWEVDNNRMITHDIADSLPNFGARQHIGDTYLLEDTNLTAPEGWEIIKIVDLGISGTDGSEELDRILGLPTPASVICLSLCPEFVQVPEGTTYIVQLGWLNA